MMGCDTSFFAELEELRDDIEFVVEHGLAACHPDNPLWTAHCNKEPVMNYTEAKMLEVADRILLTNQKDARVNGVYTQCVSFQAPVQQRSDLQLLRSAIPGDVVYVSDEDAAFFLTADNDWIAFSGTPLSQPEPEPGSYMATLEFTELTNAQVTAQAAWVTEVDSRTPKKRVLSSRG